MDSRGKFRANLAQRRTLRRTRLADRQISAGFFVRVAPDRAEPSSPHPCLLSTELCLRLLLQRVELGRHHQQPHPAARCARGAALRPWRRDGAKTAQTGVSVPRPEPDAAGCRDLRQDGEGQGLLSRADSACLSPVYNARNGDCECRDANSLLEVVCTSVCVRVCVCFVEGCSCGNCLHLSPVPTPTHIAGT